jgi:hypothetical protein
LTLWTTPTEKTSILPKRSTAGLRVRDIQILLCGFRSAPSRQTGQEGILIDKPVEIIGDGNPDEVVIEAAGKEAVLFKASMGRIASLILRQAGGGAWR